MSTPLFSLRGLGASPEAEVTVEIEVKVRFGVRLESETGPAPRDPPAISISGPHRVSLTVLEPERIFSVEYELPAPGKYTIKVEWGGQTVERVVRSEPVIVVADFKLNGVFIFRQNGKVISKSKGFVRPYQVAVSPDALIYVADGDRHQVSVLNWGLWLVRTINFIPNCYGIALDSEQRLYTSEESGGRIHVFDRGGKN